MCLKNFLKVFPRKDEEESRNLKGRTEYRARPCADFYVIEKRSAGSTYWHQIDSSWRFSYEELRPTTIEEVKRILCIFVKAEKKYQERQKRLRQIEKSREVIHEDSLICN